MLKTQQITYGTDPELFFEKGGEVIGSEKIIPENGVGNGYPSKIVRDGVQLELNPCAYDQLNRVGLGITGSFHNLKALLAKFDGVSLCWRGLVDVRRDELDSLSPTSRILGCQPSKNIYSERPITVDPETYTKRSAGGHIHLGLERTRFFTGQSQFSDDPRHSLVPLLDIFVGNTGVLLDLDLGAVERRENYGRAGEYRLPTYGLEYRTLSNFWLRAYPLMSLMFGMAHVAVAVTEATFLGTDLEQELVDTVDIGKFVQAIDTNDWDLARSNFDTVRPFLARHLPDYGFPLKTGSIDKFLTFTEAVREKGLESFFPGDPIVNWTKSAPYVEFNQFLEGV